MPPNREREMDCRRIESLLPPYVDGEAGVDEGADVERHLAACPGCRSAVAAQRTARFVLQARGRAIAPALPPDLRARIEAAIDERSTGRLHWTSRLSALAAAAALLVVTVTGLEMASPSWNVLYAAQLAIDHVRCFVVERSTTAAAEPGPLEARYAEDYGWRVRVPPSNDALGLRLVAARRCPFWLGRHAHVLYRLGDRELSLYIDQGDARTPDQLHVLGHTERIWRSGDSSYALIARGVPEAELARIGSYLEHETSPR